MLWTPGMRGFSAPRAGWHPCWEYVQYDVHTFEFSVDRQKKTAFHLGDCAAISGFYKPVAPKHSDEITLNVKHFPMFKWHSEFSIESNGPNVMWGWSVAFWVSRVARQSQLNDTHTHTHTHTHTNTVVTRLQTQLPLRHEGLKVWGRYGGWLIAAAEASC